LNALSEDDLEFTKEIYINFENDLKDSLKYFNPDTNILPEKLNTKIRDFPLDFKTDEKHKEITDYIAHSLKENKTDDLGESVLRAANIRKFLG